jgi:hypothetical protein
MPYTVSVSIQFEAADAAEATAVIEGWGLADGTMIHVNTTEELASGIVDGGEITDPPPPVIEENGAAEAEMAKRIPPTPDLPPTGAEPAED